MPKCSFCHQEGHNFATCEASGSQEERIKRQQDPRIVIQNEKAKLKKKKKDEHDKQQLQLSSNQKHLHQHIKTAGFLRKEFIEQALSVENVISLVLPTDYLEKIIKILNENRYFIFISKYFFNYLLKLKIENILQYNEKQKW
jgi:hypothetical protein